MGQCLSLNKIPFSLNQGRQEYFSSEPHQQSANVAQSSNEASSGFSNPFGQRPAGMPRPTAPLTPRPAPPTNLKNRFIDALKEQKPLFSAEQQAAIDRLETFDQRKHCGLKNRDLFPVENATLRSDGAARETLKRTASFLSIRDVLVDTVQSLGDAFELDGDDRLLSKLLLTAQAEAIRHHVEIGKNDVYRKIANGERICPMLMDHERFSRFLQHEQTTLREIVQSCQMSGPARNARLASSLERLAFSYLGSTNRLPSGMANEESICFGDVQLTDELVKVWIGTELEAATHIYPRENIQTALIVLDPGDSTNCIADPLDGSPDEQFYAMGFEHCSVPTKQAAVFIQALFFNLGWLELKIAELNAALPTASGQEARIAGLSQADSDYIGSAEIGDRCDEHDLDPQNRRKDLVDAVSKLHLYAHVFSAVDNEHNLMLDPDLTAWVRSPQFKKDLAGIKYPEFRAWMVNKECVGSVLRQTPVFQGR